MQTRSHGQNTLRTSSTAKLVQPDKSPWGSAARSMETQKNLLEGAAADQLRGRKGGPRRVAVAGKPAVSRDSTADL